jgi:hypothetical protein
VNEKNIFESQGNKIEKLEAESQKQADSLAVLQGKIVDLNYFTLQGNDNAMTYLENMGYEAAAVEAMVSDQILEYNFVKGNNPLVPFEGMNGDMKINRLKFLNHKWILTEFTDGKFWGEMILEYSFNENKELEFKTVSSFLYPN